MSLAEDMSVRSEDSRHHIRIGSRTVFTCVVRRDGERQITPLKWFLAGFFEGMSGPLMMGASSRIRPGSVGKLLPPRLKRPRPSMPAAFRELGRSMEAATLAKIKDRGLQTHKVTDKRLDEHGKMRELSRVEIRAASADGQPQERS